MTSRDVVNRVQRVTKPIKVGHTGTLDHMPTGVLLLAVGSATRLVEFSHLMPKSYEADFRLGFQSDTLDIEGQVEQLEGATRVGEDAWVRAMSQWVGNVKQTPPKFSAINIQGKRAHQLARKGVEFEVPEREVNIHQLRLLRFEFPEITMAIDCGTGTYIRTLGDDIAQSLGSGAVMTRLVRTSVGPFQLANCLSLEQLVDIDAVSAYLCSPTTLLGELPQVVLNEVECRQIRNGIPLAVRPPFDGLQTTYERPAAAVDEAGEIVAILERGGSQLRSRRVFQKTNAMTQPSATNSPHSPES